MIKTASNFFVNQQYDELSQRYDILCSLRSADTAVLPDPKAWQDVVWTPHRRHLLLFQCPKLHSGT